MGLKEIMGPLLKWWWLIAVATLVAGIASYLSVKQQPLLYQANTTIMIGRAIDNPNPSGNDFSLGQQLASTYADIARREPVRERTMAALGLRSLPDYTVMALPNTQLIGITVSDVSPERAQAVANELANQLILQSPTASHPEDQERHEFVTEQLDELEATIQETRDEILAKQAELNNAVGARQISDVQNQIAALQTKLGELQSNYGMLLSTTERGAINTLTVIDTAALPKRPIGPNRMMTVIVATVMGFVLASAAAYLLEYLDDTLKGREDVERDLSLPVLGSIGRVGNLEQTALDQPLTTHSPRSPIAEDYRRLRTNLLMSVSNSSKLVLLVTSAGPKEGKSTVASNLAAMLALAGKKVILLDADLYRPSLHKFFDRPHDFGLTNLLVDSSLTLKSASFQTSVENLWLIPSGSPPPNPTDLLATTEMQHRLEQMTKVVDCVIIDGPPALAVSDAAVLGSLATHVLLVVSAGHVRRELVRNVKSSFEQSGITMLGVVLNNVASQRAAGYYESLFYPSYSGEDAREKDRMATRWLRALPFLRKGDPGKKSKQKKEPAGQIPTGGDVAMEQLRARPGTPGGE